MLDKAVEGVKSVVRPNGLPLVGQVAAGQPVLAEENIEEYVEVPGLAGGQDGEYLLRVRGDSMKDAGILEGDHVVVRPQSTAKDGQIVVALVGEGLSNAEIAERLVVSPATAKTHVSRAMTKLHVRDRAHLVVIAYETGLVRPGWTN